jgi:hypothetical protein
VARSCASRDFQSVLARSRRRVNRAWILGTGLEPFDKIDDSAVLVEEENVKGNVSVLHPE